MAISSNRTTNTNIAELLNKEFMAVTDRTKDAPPNTTNAFKPTAASSKIIAKIGKKNIFETNSPMEPGAVLSSISAFPADGDPSCINNNANVIKNQDDRSLSIANSTGSCGASVDSSLVVRSVLDHVTAGLPETQVVAIETMLGSELAKYSKQTRHLGGINKPKSVLQGIASISKALSDVGGPLKDKIHLNSLLGCVEKSGLNGDESNLISKIVLSGLLTQSLCVSPQKFSDTIVDLSKSGKYTNGDLIKGIVSSFSGATKKSPADKTALLSTISTLIGPSINSDVVTSSDSTNLFISSLTGNRSLTKDTTVEYNNATTALSAVNPSWNKDNSGVNNLSRTKGNGYLTALSKGLLVNSSILGSAITNTPSTVTPTDPKTIAKQILAANISKTNVVNGDSLSLPAYS